MTGQSHELWLQAASARVFLEPGSVNRAESQLFKVWKGSGVVMENTLLQEFWIQYHDLCLQTAQLKVNQYQTQGEQGMRSSLSISFNFSVHVSTHNREVFLVV